MNSATPVGAVLRGLTAAAIGTLAMDLQQYVVYRRSGGTTAFGAWEFKQVQTWEEASTPGQVGKRLAEAWTGKVLAPRWAGTTNNIMHWAFGTQFGAVLGIVVGSREIPPRVLGPVYGVSVWLFGYAALPSGNFYKPMWKYDAKTLGKDLFSHLVYGAATGIAFTLLGPRKGR